MIFVSDEELERLKREIHTRLREGVSEELRGWNWDRPPVAPYSRSILFGVSALAGRYCENFRDIYLRYVLKRKVPVSEKLVRGLFFHRLIYRTISAARSIMLSSWPFKIEELEKALDSIRDLVGKSAEDVALRLGKEPSPEDMVRAEALRKFMVRQIVCEVERVRMRHPWPNVETVLAEALPSVAERRIDGSRLGLSRSLSVDLLEGNLILEVKTGDVRSFHKYAIAGYALALEAATGVPHDAGIIIYVGFLENGDPVLRHRSVLVDDALRREFLAIRDEAAEIVENGIDPGMPAHCPDYCPWRPVCHG